MVYASKTAQRRLRTPSQWSVLIQEWHQSGLSKAAFCRQHKICMSVFYRHSCAFSSVSALSLKKEEARQLRSESPSLPAALLKDFIPVSLQEEKRTSPQLEVILATGHRFCIQGIESWEQISSFLHKIVTS